MKKSLLSCFFGGRPSDLFEKLPTEVTLIILNYVKPEYVFIEKYSNTEIKSIDQYEEILKAIAVADAVCDNSKESNELDTIGYVYRILTNQYFIITNKLEYFQFIGGGKHCKRKNIRIAFQVLNININESCFKIPKLADLLLLSCNNYITFHHRIY